jgi:hypothetical protein
MMFSISALFAYERTPPLLRNTLLLHALKNLCLAYFSPQIWRRCSQSQRGHFEIAGRSEIACSPDEKAVQHIA